MYASACARAHARRGGIPFSASSARRDRSVRLHLLSILAPMLHSPCPLPSCPLPVSHKSRARTLRQAGKPLFQLYPLSPGTAQETRIRHQRESLEATSRAPRTGQSRRKRPHSSVRRLRLSVGRHSRHHLRRLRAWCVPGKWPYQDPFCQDPARVREAGMRRTALLR